jgi:hypothetical protein
MTREEKLEKALRDVADILDSFAAMEDEEGRRHAAAWTRRIAANARAALAAPPSGTPGRGIAGRTPEEIARAFHDAYEALAPHFGYRTREASAKPWDEVPPSNRDLMIATVRAVLFEPIGTHPGPAPRPLAETPRAPVPPALLADLRARVVGRELGASPEVCLDVGRAYLASEPAPASRSGDPGARCPKCGGDTQFVILHRDGSGRRLFACNDASCGGAVWMPRAAPPPASGDARTPKEEP